jgi:predicted RNase H-like nuclease (RuvC/YqgF family)
LRSKTVKEANKVIDKLISDKKELKAENNQLKKEVERLKLENTQLKAELAKMKDLKLLNNELRAELKQLKAKREDYALLEDFVKTIKQELKEKNLNIDDLIHLFSQIELYLSGETDKLTENTAKYWINNNRKNVLSIEYEFFELDVNQVNTEINKYYDELDNDYENQIDF